MWRATLRGLIARRLRLAATLMAIVLGVAFVTATYVMTDTLSAVIDHVFLGAANGVDVTVRAASVGGTTGLGADRARLPDSVLDTVRRVPGVRDASGIVLGLATIINHKGRPVRPRAGPGIGLSWPTSDRLGPVRIRDGHPPREANEIVLDVSTLHAAHAHVGDMVRVATTGPAQRFRIVGTMTYGDSTAVGPTLVSFQLPTAQRLFGAPGLLDAINVVGAKGMSVDALQQRLTSALPAGVEAIGARQAAQEDAATLHDGLAVFEAIVLVFAGVGVFVGAFIIFNTFGVLVAQRVREIGLLRALGADGRQVRRSVLGEAAILGVMGGGIGLAVGVALAALLMDVLRGLGVGIPGTPVHVAPRTVVVAFAVGVVVTAIASLVPARRAARVSPMEALAETPTDSAARPGSGLRRRDALIGALSIGAAGAFLFRATSGHPPYPLAWFAVGALLLIVGVSWLGPLGSRPMARGLGTPLSRVSGVSGALARENALRNPRRSATTAATLMVGLTLMSLTTIVAASVTSSIGGAIDQGLHASFVLTGPELFPFSTQARDAVAENPDVAAAVAVRLGNGRVNGGATRIAAVDPTLFPTVVDLHVTSGSMRALGPATVLVHEGVAKQHHWHVGDFIPMTFARTGTVPARIAGIYTRNQLVFASYVIPLETYEIGFGTQQDSFVYVKLRPAANVTTVRRGIEEAVVPFYTVEVHDPAGFSSVLDDQVRQAVGMVWALLALAVLTGVLGIVNTLALAVYERTRELGLLRTIGMARRQVWVMVGGEAVLLALVGAVFGVGLGALLGWVLARILADDGLDVFTVPLMQLGGLVVLAGLAGVAASLLPAWRASRLDVRDAIAHE